MTATPEAIASGPGGVGAIAATFAAILERGDEVLLPDPGWPNYRMMLPWLRARAVFYPCPPSAGFQPDLDALERLFTPRTKVLVVNSPNNPTGAVYPASTIATMIELPRRHNAWLLIAEPAGAFYIMADVSPAGLAAREFAFTFLRERGVSVAPGTAFGQVARDAVRISLASSDADLQEGVGRLADFVHRGTWTRPF